MERSFRLAALDTLEMDMWWSTIYRSDSGGDTSELGKKEPNAIFRWM